MGEKTFRDLEHQGWLEKADAYRDIFGRIAQGTVVAPCEGGACFAAPLEFRIL